MKGQPKHRGPSELTGKRPALSKGGNVKQTPRRLAIWVDHREASVVVIEDGRIIKREKIESRIDKEEHHPDWSRSHLQARKQEHLNRFYEAIVHQIDPRDEILILGPGLAKHELDHHIRLRRALKNQVIGLESAPRLPVHEMVERARNAGAGSRIGGKTMGRTSSTIDV
jgi:stalled ribosome rescue protein Dom34